MTKRPQRPVLTPVTPITPTLEERAHARRLAARYQATRPVSLNTPALGPVNLGRIAREAFPVDRWKRAAIRRRQRSAQDTRRAAIAIGVMAFALRDLSLRYRLVSTGSPSRPAA